MKKNIDLLHLNIKKYITLKKNRVTPETHLTAPLGKPGQTFCRQNQEIKG